MKRTINILMIVALIIGLGAIAAPAQAAAYGTQFITSVTYQNVGTGAATINFTFYAAGSSTPITVSRPDLQPMAASSLFVGDFIAGTFTGSGILTSNQPVVATLVQVPQSTTVKSRPLSNAFSSGASSVRIPTVLKGLANTNSIVYIQNVDSVAADLTVSFIPTTGSTLTETITNLPSGSAKVYDMGVVASINGTPIATFNGSLVVTSKKTGTATDGLVVATSMEASTLNNYSAYAFDGFMTSGTKVYLPSAFCGFTNTAVTNATTFYAVQNVSDTTATVTLTYSNGNSHPAVDILPGKKQSFDSCAVNTPGFLGAATITSTGGNVVAIGKVVSATLFTAYEGVVNGATKVSVPYVRYTTTNWFNGTRQRTNIAIQNVGTASIAAGALSVKFYDASGTLRGTITNPSLIAIGGKWSTNASTIDPEFGYGSPTGGAAIVEAPQALAVIARVETYISPTTVGEDYNGISIP
jgi:hypothetical protein